MYTIATQALVDCAKHAVLHAFKLCPPPPSVNRGAWFAEILESQRKSPGSSTNVSVAEKLGADVFDNVGESSKGSDVCVRIVRKYVTVAVLGT